MDIVGAPLLDPAEWPLPDAGRDAGRGPMGGGDRDSAPGSHTPPPSCTGASSSSGSRAATATSGALTAPQGPQKSPRGLGGPAGLRGLSPNWPASGLGACATQRASSSTQRAGTSASSAWAP
eukprot:8849903-Pyramimonas_sp.AAC.1